MSSLSMLMALALAGAPAAAPAPMPPVVQRQAAQLDSTYGCLACHADKRSAFVEGVHAERGIQCRDCHGGDPTATMLPAAHRGGFTGSPGKVATVALCGSCHSNPNKMRQYGLTTGQTAEFRTSRHGILLLEKRDENAPTCTDCHDAHKILRPDDARSTVYPTNIAGTCGRCHEDKALMAKYRLPTDQVSQFNRSAHGVALLADQNFAAPTCLGCHGSHSALPPATMEIANVCSRCHVLVGTAFESGPHGKAARGGKLAGCVGCHGNHDTERVPVDSLAATCTKCHAAGTEAETLGRTIQQDATQAADDLVAAQEAIEELDRMGKQTGDLRFRYQTARTAFLQITEVQHSMDLDRLEELTRKVRSISRDLRGAAEAAAEQQWEHRLWLAPVWFLALAWISLSWLTLRRIERKGPRQ
jgi:hypothetical protein